jgi:PAS domain S-box-containing protein
MKKTQAALKESEDLYRSLFENSPLPKLVAKKSNLHLVKVNRRAIQHYGYSEKELLSMTAFDLRIREEHADLLHIMEEGPDKVVKNKIVRHRKKNGDLLYVQIALDEIQFMGIPCYLVLINDLTEQLRLEKELSEEKLIRQKEIARATIDGQEKQRAQIGKELHDNVNQLLASAKMYVSSMHSENAREMDLIQRTRESLRICTEEIRTLSKSIVPPSLGDIGFAEAIDELVENIQAGHTRTRFTTQLFLDENRLTQELKLSIYRIIQEQFSNIMKHASADKADLQLKQDGDALHLVISDNGKGFDTTQKRKGIGITNIINRAELYNGSVQIVSSPGNGCTLHIKFEV